MNNPEASLTLLRQAVADFNRYDKLALATYLTGSSNPKHQYLIELPDWGKLSSKLADACELSDRFTPAAKIFFAIELLELQIDRDEFDDGDGELWGPEEEPDWTRAIAEVNSPEAQEKPTPTVPGGDNFYGVAVPGFGREVLQ
jgi:hypothetical protein